MFNEDFDPLDDLQQTMILLGKHSEVIADIIQAHNKMARDIDNQRQIIRDQARRISVLERSLRQ